MASDDETPAARKNTLLKEYDVEGKLTANTGSDFETLFL